MYWYRKICSVSSINRYDELCLVNKRCVRAYCKKENELKIAIQKLETLEKEVDDLQMKRRQLNERIQELCTRYLNYKQRKDEELLEFRVLLKEANLTIERLTEESLVVIQEKEKGTLFERLLGNEDSNKNELGHYVR